MKTTTTIALLLAATAAATPQNPMTLRDCMAYAIDKSTQIEIKHLDNADAQISRRNAILSAFTPTVSAGVYAYSNFGRSIDPETNTYINTVSFNHGYQVAGSLTLFNGFEALNNIRISRTAVRLGASEEQKMRDDICLATMEAYCNVVYYTQLADVLGQHVLTAQDNLRLMQKQYDLGRKGYADVVQMEAELADKEYELVSTANLRDDALLALKALMLWPVADTLAIDMAIATDTLPSPDTNAADAQAVAQFASTYNAQVAVAKGNMDKAQYALKAARGSFLPTLALQGGWSTSYYTYPGMDGYQADPYKTQLKNNSGEYVQLSLSIPIYDRLSRHSNLKNKKNDLERADAEYRQTVSDIKSEVYRAVHELHGALKSFWQAERQSAVQEEAYRLNQSKLRQGLISPLDFSTVSDAYIEAKAKQLNARLQLLLKGSVVKYYNGISYIEQ